MVFRNVGDAKVSAARAQIELFALALDQYRLDNDFYPGTTQGLSALRERPTGEPGALRDRGVAGRGGPSSRGKSPRPGDRLSRDRGARLLRRAARARHWRERTARVGIAAPNADHGT